METGFYYLQSRYYDAGIGRFLNTDSEVIGVGGDVIGYNLYSYCGNNPVNRSDQNGHAWKDVKNRISNAWNKVKNMAKKITDVVSKNVGTAINVGKEKTTNRSYYWGMTLESGTGYSKSFSTEKPINAYINIPEKRLELWEYGSGIDVNVNGYGGSLQIGAENSVAIHLKNNSIEFGRNSLGRVYVKYTFFSYEQYAYNKFILNLPEVMVVAAGIAYVPEIVVPFVATSIQMYK